MNKLRKKNKLLSSLLIQKIQRFGNIIWGKTQIGSYDNNSACAEWTAGENKLRLMHLACVNAQRVQVLFLPGTVPQWKVIENAYLENKTYNNGSVKMPPTPSIDRWF